jgi:hypothetical protein
MRDSQDLTSLAKKFDASGYLSPVSDIVALMVFEHQMHVRTSDAECADSCPSRPFSELPLRQPRVDVKGAFSGRGRLDGTFHLDRGWKDFRTKREKDVSFEENDRACAASSRYQGYFLMRAAMISAARSRLRSQLILPGPLLANHLHQVDRPQHTLG